MSDVIWLVEIDGYHTVNLAATTIYLTTGPGMTTKPTDTPANTVYRAAIKDEIVLRQDMFSKATTYGAIQTGQGEIRISNADGELDDYINIAVDGREVRAYAGPQGGDMPSDFTRVLTATAESLRFDGDDIVITLRDRLAILDLPLIQTRYAGNNSAPNGVEGDSAFKDRVKPKLYGKAINVSPLLVNTSKSIWQFCSNQATVSAVRDRGAALTAGAAYTSQTDMETTAPAAGQYRVWSSSSGTYFRLGTEPAGTITGDIYTSETKVASNLSTIAQDAGISSGDINSTDVTNLNTANSASAGIWVDGDSTALDVMTELANSIGAWFGFDNNNVMRMGRLEAPSGTAAFSIIQDRIEQLSIISTADDDRGIPPWAVRLQYDKNYTVQTNLDKTYATSTIVVYCRDQYRSTYDSDSSVKTAHKLSQELIFNTLLNTRSDAVTEGTRRLSLYKVGRRMYDAQVILQPSQIAALRLGITIEIVYPRYGLDSGKKLVVVGMTVSSESSRVNLKLWG